MVVLIASVAIVGLPLGNGFVSELLIYMGALRGALLPRTDIAAVAIAVVIGLALAGGLAAICFTKLIGIGFLGEPRSTAASKASESPRVMTVPMLAMASLCVGIGLNAYAIPGILIPVVGSILGIQEPATAVTLDSVRRILTILSLATGSLVAAILGLALLRRLLIRTRSVRTAGTWDCGYAAPSQRMQYSGFSYVQTTASLLRRLVFAQRRFVPPAGFFPRQSSFMIRLHDAFLFGFYEPLFRGMGWALGRLRWLQHGNVHLYVLYILITMLALLFWGLR
jgi:hydrogenase-4 component B